MNKTDIVEYYTDSGLALRVSSNLVPNKGDVVTFCGNSYLVIGRSFCIDNAGSIFEAQCRANIELEEYNQ